MGGTIAVVPRNNNLGLGPTQQLNRHRSLKANRVRSSNNSSRDNISRLVWAANAVEMDVQLRTRRSFCLWHNEWHDYDGETCGDESKSSLEGK
jgi:hypothetical protein